jgi:hypothetical protein
MMTGLGGLGAVNARLLSRSAALVGLLDDDDFCAAEICPGGAGIGPQLRHCADFYRALLEGLDCGRVDYDARKRDALFEVNRAYAARELCALAEAVHALDGLRDRPLAVRTEAAALACGAAPWCESSLRRELLVLLSHTVHHHALVGERLRARGLDPGADFGIAPSTRAHAEQTCAR